MSEQDRLKKFGPNEWLVDEMFERYRQDPNSVDKAWWDFFADFQPEVRAVNPVAGPGALVSTPPVATPTPAPAVTPAAVTPIATPAATPAAVTPAVTPAAEAQVETLRGVGEIGRAHV